MSDNSEQQVDIDADDLADEALDRSEAPALITKSGWPPQCAIVP